MDIGSPRSYIHRPHLLVPDGSVISEICAFHPERVSYGYKVLSKDHSIDSHVCHHIRVHLHY